MTLEDTLRDLAKRGEITHISLTPSGKGWRASFSPSSITGASFGEDRDPVNALLLALASAKLRKRLPFKDGGGRVKETQEDDLEGLM